MATNGNDSFLRHQAYSYMQEQLIQGRWGQNDRISEKTIADELGISRTPVREAIGKLIGEGLLYQVPSSGTFVTKPDRQSIAEMFEVRMALEGLAAEKAAELIKAPEVRELQRQLLVMRNAARAFRDTGETCMTGEILTRFITADRAMHKSLLSIADNRLAWNIVHTGRIQTLIFGLHSYERDLHHIAYTLRAHSRVLQAVKRRDGVSARQAMEAHIRNSMKDALWAYDHHDAVSHRGPTVKA